jgi:D-tyrosyl-tRNA(Tyr) deacylase
MRALVQRVARAAVRVDGRVTGSIENGLLVFLGIRDGDTAADAAAFARKTAELRIFEDADGRMNLDVGAAGGAVLCVSQFTLYGDVRRGRRPSFSEAAAGPVAEPVYEAFCEAIEGLGLRCERGVFGAHMDVDLVNDGPVTLWLDSDDLARPRRA